MDKSSHIKEIKTRLALSAVVGERVELKGRSPNFSGLCPFHQEKTPSFHVRDNLARFKCFGCGVSGDHFEFLMRVRGISFVEAVSELAQKAGLTAAVRLEKKITPKEKNVLAAQKIAQEYFLNEVLSTAQAKDYLQHKRGLGERMIKQAGIGFGGTSKEKFASYLKSKGVSDELAVEAGLLKQGRFSLIPQFLNRVTFPIRNNDGVIVGFGGRAFLPDDDDAPKYVNTHSYRHYEKRKSLYGWFESKSAIVKGAVPVLVEGYFDAMAMWAAGVPALALCGTALTDEHVKLVRTMSTKLMICFDSDNAGVNALRNALVLLYRMNLEPSLVVLDEKDAGDYLQKKNLSGLKNKLASLADPMCFLVDHAALLAQESVSERVQQIDLLMPIFVAMSRPLVRRQYAAYLAKRLHEEPAVVWAEIAHKLKTARPVKAVAPAPTPMMQRRSLLPHDRLALEIALSCPALIADMDEILPYLETKELLQSVQKLYDLDDKSPIEDLMQKAAGNEWWSSIEPYLRDRIILSDEEARTSVDALIEKIALEKKRASIKTKRLELESFLRKKDYASVLSSLKEKSELLGEHNAARKKIDVKRFEAKVVTPIKTVQAAEKIKVAPRDESFFDTTEDW